MKIVISDSDRVSEDIEREILAAAGLGFDLKHCVTEEDVIRDCAGAEVIMNEYAPLTRRVFKALAPRLRFVIRYGVGVNNIDLRAASEFGVQVSNVPDYGTNEVAEHCLALTMDLCRKITRMNNEVQGGNWNYGEAIPLYRLADQTLGIIGMGRNGSAFAVKARGVFGRFLGYFHHEKKIGDPDFVKAVSLDEVLRQSDVVALHLPLTDQTRHMINMDAFSKMKKSAYLVNVSRGALIDEADLHEALQKGMIAGAALDVMEREPISVNSPLLHHSNCLVTPHMAWYSEQASRDLQTKAAEEVVRFARGEKLRSPVNRLSVNSAAR